MLWAFFVHYLPEELVVDDDWVFRYILRSAFILYKVLNELPNALDTVGFEYLLVFACFVLELLYVSANAVLSFSRSPSDYVFVHYTSQSQGETYSGQ